MLPSWIGRFDAHDFAGTLTVCQGWQIAQFIRAIAEVAPNLVWYASDVSAPGSLFWSRFRGTTPGKIGVSDDIALHVETIPQFESGVFVGVPTSITNPKFRDGGLWTEDDDDSDLGDTIVEIRTFDTSYILIATTSVAVRARLTGGWDPSRMDV